MLGLQMDVPLLVSGILDHAARYHGSTEIVARTTSGRIHRTDYRTTHARTKKLAEALGRLGLKRGDVAASLAWNTHRHFELFFGVTGAGMVLHTVNPRLFADQIVYILNHAEGRVLFVDAATLPLYTAIAARCPRIEHVILMEDAADMPAADVGCRPLCYEDLLDAETGDYEWPELDERAAATICYTSGTTGDPKGVVYSNRGAVLVSLLMAGFVRTGGLSGHVETLMPLAPMFHGNAWQFPYIAPMIGARLILPGRHYEPQALFDLMAGEAVTVACGVPSMWTILVDWMEAGGERFDNLRALSSGSAPPEALVARLEGLGAEFGQAWGMTEVIGGSLPMLAAGSDRLSTADRLSRKLDAGQATFGVTYRLVDDDGNEVPQDGRRAGHLLVRSAWAAAAYHKEDPVRPKRYPGWLETGDIATIDGAGRIRLTDRSKDVIKSGGEWISSLTLEAIAASHADVRHAAVIARPHPKWHERPLLVVERRAGGTVRKEALLDHMRGKVANWWLPDDVVFIPRMPLTGTGKVHKQALRDLGLAGSADGIFDLVPLGTARAAATGECTPSPGRPATFDRWAGSSRCGAQS